MPKRVSGLLCCWALLRNNNMTTIFEVSLQVTVVGVLPLVTVELRHLGTETVTADIGVSHVVLYCVKRSMSEFAAMLPQV